MPAITTSVCTQVFEGIPLITGPKASKSPLKREQIYRVLEAVRRTFPLLRDDPSLLTPEWRRINAAYDIPSTGFCSIASNAVYHMLGGKAAGLTAMVVKYYDPELEALIPEKKGIGSHWWLRDRDGAFIDPTVDQYTSRGKEPPYSELKGRGKGFNTELTVPTIAGKKMMDLAIQFLLEDGFQPNGLPFRE